MKLTGILLAILYFFPLSSVAQTNDIDFVKQKVELDYPSFKEKTTPAAFRLLVEKIVDKYGPDTFQVISRIVSFFNDQHLGVIEPKKWLQRDTVQCEANRLNVIGYLNKKGGKKKYEGYWLTNYNDCIIGIKQGADSEHYIAYVIEDRGGKLIPGQIKGQFVLTEHENYEADYYSSYSGKRVLQEAVFRNDTVFTVGAGDKWKKLRKYHFPMLPTLPEFNYNVRGRLISSKTYLLTVPGCSPKNVAQLDSVVRADYHLITKTENLIVDVTNNPGGKSAIYESLLPFIYTHPYEPICAYTYCTADGAKEQEETFEGYKQSRNMDSAAQATWIAFIKMMRDSVGKLILYKEDTVRNNAILPYPAHIGVIMNFATQSAAEMLVLTFMHSKKVTLFGEHTRGGVDHLSFYPINCPSGKYQLYMPISKRFIPVGEQPVDGKGIFPQIPLKDPESNWVDAVIRYYEKKH